MRIVAGEFSSRRIEAPKGRTTRPTLDKVREAVFSSLGGYLDEGLFLDLYAGSGANGLEAVSRGVSGAVFVDNSRNAVEVIRRNIRSLGCQERCRVLPVSDRKALLKLKDEQVRFRYVYLDPPYEKQTNEEILRLLQEYDLLEENAVIVIESLKEDVYAGQVGALVCYRTAVYGITAIHYYRFEKEEGIKE